MSWTAEKKVYINGQEVEYTSPEALKQKIMETAREMGLARFDVYINGQKVTPDRFADVISGITEDINIEIVSADKAA